MALGCSPSVLLRSPARVATRQHTAMQPMCVARSASERGLGSTRIQVQQRQNTALPQRQPYSGNPVGVAQQQQEGPVQELSPALPPALDKALSKYSAAWAAIPSRYKIVLAGSLSFVICNMVSAVGVSAPWLLLLPHESAAAASYSLVSAACMST